MAKQTINIGTAPNTGTGDPLRTAFTKVNDNFADTEFDNIQVTNRVGVVGTPVTFTKPANTNTQDEIDTDLSLTRPFGYGAGIYNSAVEEGWDPNTSPANTEWNADGWDNLDDVKNRIYKPFRETLQNRIGEMILSADLIMHDITNDKYYKFKFTQWAQGPEHTGAFEYTRELLDTTTSVGIVFPDGSSQVKAVSDASDLYDKNNLLNGSKKWLQPDIGKIWSIEHKTGGIKVDTNQVVPEDINTTISLVSNSNSFYVPRDETTQRIQDYWDGVEGGYDYTRIVIDGVEYEGFVSTFNSNGWLIYIYDPPSFDVGTNIIVRYYGNQIPAKWFDAADYENSENFLGAIVNYYAVVENRGQRIGTVWFTGTHDEYGDFDAEELGDRSGNYTDLEMYRRPDSQMPYTSLWLTTNSSNAEAVFILWDAKLFYGENGIVTPEIIDD
jgi:hypothetical protein